MLARREHSRHEIRQKLTELGALQADTEQVLEELVTRRLQSEVRFAEIFVRSRAGRGYGPRSIEADLRAKGLDAEQLAVALSESGYDWVRQAVEVRERRFGRPVPREPKEKARQMRFLQYRGFTQAQLSHALRHTVATVDDEAPLDD